MQDWLLSFGHHIEHASWVMALDDDPHLLTGMFVIHYFSVFLVLGTSAVVDLRLAGLAVPRLNAAAMAEALFPWTWTAVALGSVTGFFMFVPEASGFFSAPAFFIKLALIVVAVVVGLAVQAKARIWGQMPVTPVRARLMALVSLALWIGVVLAALEIAQQADI